MPYCGQCGNELKETDSFCGACGAKQVQTQPQTSAAIPPPRKPIPSQPMPPQKRSGKTNWGIIVMGVLAAGLVTFGILYGIGSSELSKAKANIADLENNVTALETQLAAEQTHAASLQTQLTAAINDLNSSQAQVTQLQADLNASELRITTLQSELNEASVELASLTATNAELTGELTLIKDPRHFNSLQELQTWLENDDTDTNSAYSSLTPQAKAYVLEIKALRDGYILSACIDWDSNFIYTWNVAVIGDAVYSVNAATDVITPGPSFSDALPLHPLPLS